MKTIHRSYDETVGDFHRLCRFAIKHHEHLRAHSTWCLGRIVDWKYGLYPSKTAYPAFCDQNAHLWFDAFGELAGCVISEGGDADFVILTAEGYRFLYAEMLQWVLANWADRGPSLSTEVNERQTLEMRALERSGLHPTATFYNWRFDLTQALPPRVPLEAGFTIVDLATHPDYRAQRLLRDNAFSDKSAVSEDELRHELAFYNHMHEGPIYHPECDLCVMAPDGQFVAGCEALIDAHNCEADVERVCTHSDFRRRGFARAVIQECLVRLQEMGMRRAYIAGYSPAAISLYGSLGAVEQTKCFVYEVGES